MTRRSPLPPLLRLLPAVLLVVGATVAVAPVPAHGVETQPVPADEAPPAPEVAVEPAAPEPPAPGAPAATAGSASEGAAAAGSAAAEPDPAADFFLSRCAGCHTIGEGVLTGPDLTTAIGWPADDLAKAVERMEKNVGPMTDEQVASLVALLEDPRVKQRLAASRERQVAEMAATLEPASPRRGEELFFGARRLAAGGLPCAACHHAAGRGGNLAVDLTSVGARLGEPALVSAAQNPGFPLMKAAYRGHPVTRQEAVHLAAWLTSLAPAEGEAAAPPAGATAGGVVPVGAWGAAAAAAFGVLMVFLYRRRQRGVRRNLVRAAMRR